MINAPLYHCAPIDKRKESVRDANHQSMKSSVDSFCVHLRNLHETHGFPLRVISIGFGSGSSVLRNTHVIPDSSLLLSSETNAIKKFQGKRAVELILSVENSNAWPNTVRAFSASKVAMYIALAQSLRLLNTAAQTDFNAAMSFCVAHSNRVWVLLNLGTSNNLLLLRLTLSIPEEHQLLSNSSHSINTLQRILHDVPYIHSVLIDASLKHSIFSASARTAKRWISSHFLSPHIPSQLIELSLLSSSFNSQQPSRSVCSALIQWWTTLSSLDSSKQHPILFRISSDSNPAFTHTNTHSKTAAIVVHINDNHRFAFEINRAVLSRLSSLSKSALHSLNIHQHLNESLLFSDDSMELNLWSKLFRVDTSVFDVIFYLNSTLTNNSKKRAREQAVQFLNSIIQDKQSELNPQLHQELALACALPIHHFVSLLETHFSKYALFFYDKVRDFHCSSSRSIPATISKCFNIGFLCFY